MLQRKSESQSTNLNMDGKLGKNIVSMLNLFYLISFLWLYKRIYLFLEKVHVPMQLLQSCPTLCDPMNYSLPGSSVDGNLQARILEWAAMPSFRASS